MSRTREEGNEYDNQSGDGVPRQAGCFHLLSMVCCPPGNWVSCQVECFHLLFQGASPCFLHTTPSPPPSLLPQRRAVLGSKPL